MAKQSGLGDNFYIAGYDLSGDLSSIDKISGGPALNDATSIKQFANARLPLQRDAGWSFTSWFENSSTVAAPGVPSSGTPVVSTFNFPVLVTVIGGTGTQVNINGVNQGSFDGTYVLPALGTITLTYTVAPTWSWILVGTEHNALKTPIPSADMVASYFRGTAIGSPAAGMVCKQTNYDPTRDSKGALTLKVDLVSNGFGYEWGKQLTAGLRTDLVATTGAFFDDGAASNFGCQAYMQLTGFVGTSVDVTVQHCATSGGTYTTLLDFGAQTAIGGFRQATANNVTVNEFLKVVTTGTFTYAQFAVTFVRNAYAGQVF